MTTKDTKIIDLNLFSGSSELLRQSVGGFYNITAEGEIYFEESEINIDHVSPREIEFVESGDISMPLEAILPSIKYANRLHANPSDTDIVSDEDWKTFIIGGEFGNKSYTGMINDAIYADHYNKTPLPYLPREVINTDNQASLSITTEYYNYYPRFQNTVAALDTELQAPNFYLLDESLFAPADTPESSISKYEYRDIKNYFSDSYINSEKIETQKNIFILRPRRDLTISRVTRKDTTDLNATSELDSDLKYVYSLAPFGNKLEIKSELTRGNRDFRNIIIDNDYKLNFLKSLKEVFQGESGLRPSMVNFAVNTQQQESTGIATRDTKTTTTIPIKIVDAPTMFLYNYRNPISEVNDISLINSSSYLPEMNCAFDTTGIYRYENTEKSLSVLNDVVDKIKQDFGDGTTETHPIENFLDQASRPKYYETMAFRVEKIGGSPTGDSNTQNTIQNIWFLNRGAAITYLDTQVKYDTDYTYKIYKYDIVQGYKYKLSDTAVTRQAAVEGSGESSIYCLEFYDPFSGQVVNNLMGSGSLRRIIERRDLLIQKREAINDFLGSLTAQRDTVMASHDARLGSHQSQLISLPYYLTTLKNDFIDPILTSYPSFYREPPDPIPLVFPTRIPYLEEYIELSSEEFPELGTIGFNTITQIGIDAVDLVSGDKSKLNLHEVQDIAKTEAFRNYLQSLMLKIEDEMNRLDGLKTPLTDEIAAIYSSTRFVDEQDITSQSTVNSSYPRLADFNITIEPSLKIVEIPLEEKRMRIVDHPPNDFVVTPHHLLDQSNRLAFYCKYDTFSMNAVTYPPTVTNRDEQNKSAYLTGHDFLQISEQTQESVSRSRFIEVYRTTTKPKSYAGFSGTLRKLIDLRQPNGDVTPDHIFVERVKENTIYYYAFRSLSENGVAGQMSPIFESELINDGGYTYGRFQQHLEEDLAPPKPKEPLSAVKKLFNVIPNVQHLELDTTSAEFDKTSYQQLDNVSLGGANLTDRLFGDENRYFKIRLTSKKTSKKLDINIGFKKEVRK